MKVRQALLEEAPTIAQVGSLAFAFDPSYSHFYPWKDLYPEDFYLHLLQKYTKLMVTPGCVIMVLELEDGDVSKGEEANIGKLIAFATFQRSGGTQEQQDRWGADSQVKKLYRSMLGSYSALAPPNRAAHQEAIDDFWNQELTAHNSTEYTDKIDFYTLAVLPEYQRQNVGGRLMVWVGRRAAKECVPLFGDASAKAKELYLNLGGKIIGNIVQQDTTYEKTWCGRKLPARTAKRLETPVMRWDAKDVSKEQWTKIGILESQANYAESPRARL